MSVHNEVQGRYFAELIREVVQAGLEVEKYGTVYTEPYIYTDPYSFGRSRTIRGQEKYE